jgi:hypothetical protein
VEQSFSISFDKAALSFRRMIGRELQSVLRPSGRLTGVNFDLFCDELDSELGDLINFGSISSESQTNEFARRVGISIDEQTIPVTASLRTNAAEQQSINQSKAAVLKGIQTDLEVLKSAVRTGGDAVLQEIDRKRERDLTYHERVHGLEKGRSRRLQQLAFRREELEKQVARQRSEAASLFHSLKSLESKRRTFYEETIPTYRRRSPEAEHLLHEINELQEKMAEEQQDEVAYFLEDALQALNSDREAMRNDSQATELLTRRMMLMLEPVTPQQGWPVRDPSPRRSPIGDRVRQKDDYVRRTARRPRAGRKPSAG